MGRRVRPDVLTGWSMMWVICMFDCPVQTRKDARSANRFRSLLLDNGFCMKQFSVYIKPVATLDVGRNLVKDLVVFVPDNGSVSFLYVTDKQYLMAENYLGKCVQDNEEVVREEEGQFILF